MGSASGDDPAHVVDPTAAMDPFGRALTAFFAGDATATLIMRREDGLEAPLPAALFFRGADALSELERLALDRCRGRVLDIGAGAGEHSLVLQARGVPVTALDVSPAAVEIMRRRGVQDPVCADIFHWSAGDFDTLLLLGHGIGMVGDLAGLDRFLLHARGLLAAGGQILLDSTDVTRTADARHLAYHAEIGRQGRYPGEVRVQFEYGGTPGPFCGWLHVSAATLAQAAGRAGLACEVLLQHDDGEYLARLSR
jgi:SAM-dependent methyltransferase